MRMGERANFLGRNKERHVEEGRHEEKKEKRAGLWT